MISIDYKQKHKSNIGGLSSSPKNHDTGGDDKNIFASKRPTVIDKRPEKDNANYGTNAENSASVGIAKNTYEGKTVPLGNEEHLN